MDSGNLYSACQAILDDGFVVIKDAIDPSIIDDVRSWLDARENPDDSLKNNPFHGNSLLIHNLHAKDILFWKLISHPLIISICETLLNDGSYRNNEGFTLSGSAIRSVYGLQKAQQLHIDSNLPGCNYVLVLQVCIPIDQFTNESGATQIVAGSQATTSFPPNGNSLNYTDQSCLRSVSADPGDIVIFNGGAWHGAGEKTTAGRRAAVFLNYSRWFIKQSFDISNNMPHEIYTLLSEHELKISGAYYQPPFNEGENRGRKSSVPILRTYLESK